MGFDEEGPEPDPDDNIAPESILRLACTDGVMFPIAGKPSLLGYYCPAGERDVIPAQFFAGIMDFAGATAAEHRAHMLMRYTRNQESGENTPCDVIVFRAEMAGGEVQ